MGRFFSIISAMVWKNWILAKRNLKFTIPEFIMPILMCVILMLLERSRSPVQKPLRKYLSFCSVPLNMSIICDLKDCLNQPHYLKDSSMAKKFRIIYSPNTSTTINNAMMVFNRSMSTEGFRSTQELEQQFHQYDKKIPFVALDFQDSLKNDTELSKHMNIIIRFPGELREKTRVASIVQPVHTWNTQNIFDSIHLRGPREADKATGADPFYYREGVLGVQHLLAYSLILQQTSRKPLSSVQPSEMLPLIQMQRSPHAPFVQRNSIIALRLFIAIFVINMFYYQIVNLVRNIVWEKEQRLKEMMEMMGISKPYHWLGWFITCFVSVFIAILLVTFMLFIKWPKPFEAFFYHTSPTVFILFMVCYGCSVITFCFLISTFFHKANVAPEISFIVWFVTLMPFLLRMYKYGALTFNYKLVACLGANSCMAFGFALIFRLEAAQEGIGWQNLFSTKGTNNMSLGVIIMMLLLDSMLHMLLTIYFEQVFPATDREQRLHYPIISLCKRYFGRKRARKMSTAGADAASCEPEPTHLRRSVEMRNLTRHFRRTRAVHNLTMNVYEGQVTALLGHNGAGKTTTLQMVGGTLTPTAGSARVLGLDALRQSAQIRRRLGVCWQQNVLFELLTVGEHLRFFARIKGLTLADSRAEAERYLQILNLTDKSKCIPGKLSGGMQRLLCVGIALCGDSRLLLLDEPTTGMDPSIRRSVWDLIASQKEGRTILLSTHQMNEADLVGDRIAILAGGRLQCIGTSFFLKQKYGEGYHLVIEKETGCSSQRVTRLLRSYIPNLRVESETTNELKYLLERHYVKRFKRMLDHLENSMMTLHINSYGISLTTLEEVFLKVDSGDPAVVTPAEEPDLMGEKDSNLDWSVGDSNTVTESETSKSVKISSDSDYCVKRHELLKGVRLLGNQALAMLVKKVLVTWRAVWNFVAVICLSIGYLVLINIYHTGGYSPGGLPALPLTLAPYHKTTTLLQVDHQTDLDEIYMDIIKSKKDQVKIVKDISATFLKLTRQAPILASEQYLIGATVSKDLVHAWFNNDPLHTPPLALAQVLNAVYQKNLGRDHSLTFTFHPMPFKLHTEISLAKSLVGQSYQRAFSLCFMMSILSSFLVIFTVREKSTRFRHLQYVSGTNVLIFRVVSFLSDLTLFSLLCLPLFIVYVILGEYGFSNLICFCRMMLILLVCGVALVPMIYVTSFMFSNVATGVLCFFGVNLVAGSFLFLIMQVLESPAINLSDRVLNKVHNVFVFSPLYGFTTGIKDTYVVDFTKEQCAHFIHKCMEVEPVLSFERCKDYVCKYDTKDCCVEYVWNAWHRPGLLKAILTSVMVGSLMTKLTLLVEYRVFARITYAVLDVFGGKQSAAETQVPDDDVRRERETIAGLTPDQIGEGYEIILKGATKRYGDLVAVGGLWLGIKRFECFGLLGSNGAGKTTTFHMMTGAARMSGGDILVRGSSIREHPKRSHRFVGFCPQFDALLGELTVRETLLIFALLRGVPWGRCRNFIEDISLALDLLPHLRKKVRHLSGGNKRKLSTAVALTGSPKIIMLDEPTTGMDPVSKRYLWNALCDIRNSGKCLVLTSHSMEECEALCTRVAIMVNGEFKCIGTIQHLKQKFAAGCSITVKLGRDLVDTKEAVAVENHLQRAVPELHQLDRRHDMVTYTTRSKQVRYSRLFGIMEEVKEKFKIEDYSLGQMTLEQVFLSLTRQQADPI